MAEGTRLIEAPAEEARAWMYDSLEQGFDLSIAVLAAGILKRGRFLAIVSSDFGRTPFNYSHGGVLGQLASQERLAQVFDEPGFESAQSVLVEDSIRGRNFPSISRKGEPSAFLGDRVVHWCDLAKGGTQAMEVVAWGTTGYPTNAFIVDRPSEDLGLVDRGDLPGDLAEEVASSLIAIVVAAFDAESFFLWVDLDRYSVGE